MAPGPTSFSRAIRLFLYLTAGITGGAIMIVEILGARMLAPYVGTSHFVWTAQIAVTLVALAAGYYAGGRWADTGPHLRRLYLALAAAAAYLCGVALVLRPVAFWSLQFNLATGSLVASTLLFFIPLMGLAITGPFLIRVLTASLAGVGTSVGRLSAVSTLGSFAGTMLIGYLLIPLLPNTITLVLTAALLLGLSGLYFIVWERRGPGPGTLLVLAVAGGTLSALAFRAEAGGLRRDLRLLYRGNSHFGSLMVMEHPDTRLRYYFNDFLTQNTYDPDRKQGVSAFTYMLRGLADAYHPGIRRVLCVGMGVGIVPSEFARAGAQVDVVEINPAVVPLAHQFFDCDTNAFQLHIEDGRAFLNRTTNRYDAVILDAFLGDSSPSHLLSREAFAEAHRVLEPGGVLVMNCFGDLHPRRDFFVSSIDRTLKSVFRNVRLHSPGSGNAYFVASDADPLEMQRTPDLSTVHPAVRGQVDRVFGSRATPHPQHGMILTDDYNPVEFYDAGTRQEIRRQLALSME